MWKSKRRKYLEDLLEEIRDHQHELIAKSDFQQQTTEHLQQTINGLQQTLDDFWRLNNENTDKLYNRICSVETNLNYYSMIYKIMTENKYTNMELLLLQLQNPSANKILICGFYGADNFGDELMLQTLLNYIPKEKMNRVTVMLYENDGYNYYNFPGVNFIHCPKSVFDLNILAQCFDMLIWGGGALIDDSDYSKNEPTLNNMVVELSKRFIAFGKKVIALGLSSNKELKNTEYIESLRYVCSKSKYFSVRDTNTAAVLCKVGIKDIKVIDDLAFYNQLLHDEPRYKRENQKVTIGIIWICYEDTEELFKKLVFALREKFNNNLLIKCIPFYNYTNADTKYYSHVLDNLEFHDDITIVAYNNDPRKMLEEIAQTDYMVNMRYHGMILSNAANIKSLNICYDSHRHYPNKIEYLTELFGVRDRLLYFTELAENFEAQKLDFSLGNKYVGNNEELERLINLLI